MYDVIVIGARCAGAPTAMLLARKGHRVLLVDRATFPSGVPRCHFIHIPGVVLLERWGLLDALIEAKTPPIDTIRLDVGPFILVGSEPAVDGVDAAFGPRRTVLDHILVGAAVSAGAEMRESFTVQGLLTDGGRVVGVRGRGRGGTTVTDRARVVVGADGCNSLVARAVGAPTYHVRPELTCGYFSYWSGVPIDACEFYMRERRAVYAFPTNEGLTCIAMQAAMQDFPSVRRDVAGSFMGTIAQMPNLEERVRQGKREERFLGTGVLPNFYRKPYGPGWALAGDAGYHKDPYTAQGISDAFRDAESVADAIDSGLTGHMPMEEALARHEQRRNEVSLPLYALTRYLAALPTVPDELLRLLGPLRDDPAETRRFFGVLSGATPLSAFFPEGQIARMIAD
jgi:flavin-dependent dehydrogenase